MKSQKRLRKMNLILFLNLITIFIVLASFVNCNNVYSKKDFPKGFAFGASLSAYQWEGAFDEDGRKPSVWDTYVHSRNEANGDITSDGYHKYKEDVQLMMEEVLLIQRVYNFTRTYKQWNRTGIEPHVTLFHYDLPQSLEDEYGGWTNRKVIEDFTAYADVCFREFGNHVKFWTTINEGNVFTLAGYNDGTNPPGRCSTCSLGNSSTEPYIVGHNLLLAHASASRLYKEKYKDTQRGSIGYSLFFMGTNPKDDRVAVQRVIDFSIGWMLRPLMLGDYPDAMKRSVGSRLPDFSDEESKLVKGSSDFIGVIHYFPVDITNISLSGNPDFYSDMGFNLSNHFEYPVDPWNMEGVLEYIKQSYGNPPIYILENGKPLKPEMNDIARVEYLDAYIGAVLKSVKNGSDTRDYFVWSFMDVFELLLGYEQGFGLYYVNFSEPERKRSPKLSALWYSAFLKGETISLGSQDIMKPDKKSGFM